MIDLSSIVDEFYKLAYDTFVGLLNIPLSLSFNTAIILTFAWLYSEFTSIVRVMRGLVVAGWALTLGNSFFSGQTLTAWGFWLLAGAVVGLNLAWLMLKRRRRSLICPNCGNSSRFNGTIIIKRDRTVKFHNVSCAECGSLQVEKLDKAL